MFVDLDYLKEKVAGKGPKHQIMTANLSITQADGRLVWTPEMGRDNRGPYPNDSAFKKLISRAWQLNNVSDAGETYTLTAAWRQGTQLTAVYSGLYNDTIVDSDTEATLVGEPVGNGYSRITWNLNSTDFPTIVLDSNADWTLVGVEKSYTASGGNIGPVNNFVLQENTSGTAGDIYFYIPFTTATINDTESLNCTAAITLS